MSLEEKQAELDELKARYGFIEPNRGNLDDPAIKWRDGKPNYTKVNIEYFKGKTMNHVENSLEKFVEDLVKTWEMEIEHKIDSKQWTTTDANKSRGRGNDGKVFTAAEVTEFGTYNWTMENCKKDLYDSSKETFESSHELFSSAFTNGFPWELIAVFSGPPKVVFSWHHWACFDGEYRGRKGDGEVYHMYGITEAVVNKEMKIESVEIYFKPNEFLEALEGKRSFKELNGGNNIVGSGCPFAHK